MTAAQPRDDAVSDFGPRRGIIDNYDEEVRVEVDEADRPPSVFLQLSLDPANRQGPLKHTAISAFTADQADDLSGQLQAAAAYARRGDSQGAAREVDGFPRPRLSPEAKRQFVRRIVDCTDEGDAARIAERLWAMLRGDMQDRITGLIDAVHGTLETADMNDRRPALTRALRLLEPTEVAAVRRIPRPASKAGARQRGGRPVTSTTPTTSRSVLATHAAQIKRGVPRREILDAKAADGSFSPEQLEAWGIAYPPPRGWQKRLEMLAQQERRPSSSASAQGTQPDGHSSG